MLPIREWSSVFPTLEGDTVSPGHLIKVAGALPMLRAAKPMRKPPMTHQEAKVIWLLFLKP